MFLFNAVLEIVIAVTNMLLGVIYNFPLAATTEYSYLCSVRIFSQDYVVSRLQPSMRQHLLDMDT